MELVIGDLINCFNSRPTVIKPNFTSNQFSVMTSLFLSVQSTGSYDLNQSKAQIFLIARLQKQK